MLYRSSSSEGAIVQLLRGAFRTCEGKKSEEMVPPQLKYEIRGHAVPYIVDSFASEKQYSNSRSDQPGGVSYPIMVCRIRKMASYFFNTFIDLF